MARVPFIEEIARRVLVCDGAMGTMLYAKGIFLNRSFDELNLTQPDLVAEVHQAYIRAGADLIETNTFGANRIKLGAFGLADRVASLNSQGARIARHAAREAAYVAGASLKQRGSRCMGLSSNFSIPLQMNVFVIVPVSLDFDNLHRFQPSAPEPLEVQETVSVGTDGLVQHRDGASIPAPGASDRLP